MSEHRPAEVTLPTGLSGAFRGASTVLVGSRALLADRALVKLALFPILLTGLVYVGLATSALLLSDDLLELIWIMPESGWLIYLWYAAWVLVSVLLLVLLGLLFITTVGILAGPFYEKLALKILRQKGVPAQEATIMDGVQSALLRLVALLLPAVFAGALTLIPGIGAVVFVPIASFFAWLGLASEALDPPLALAGIPPAERLSFVFRNKLCLLGMGAVLHASLLVPFLVLWVLPSAVVGSTLLYADRYHAERDAEV